MSELPVTFFLAGEDDIDELRRLDADRDWRELQLGERAWVLQTYLRLRRRGRDVRLEARAPGEGLVVFHAKQERELVTTLPKGSRPVLVGVRADNRQPLAAEFEVLQNGRWANARTRFAVPHWPQPGLVPRDPSRGDRLERIAYKGFAANLAAAFRSPEWGAFLANLGIAWELDETVFQGTGTDLDAAHWADYGEVDAVLAVRPRHRGREFSKPATKLVNAWAAGVPALLGDEFAYRELRSSPLDYFEVTDLEAARAAVRRLRDEPGLYRAMVDHGAVRGSEFDVDAVSRAWEELLFDRLPALASARRRVRARGWPLAARRLARLLGRWAEGRPPR